MRATVYIERSGLFPDEEFAMITRRIVEMGVPSEQLFREAVERGVPEHSVVSFGPISPTPWPIAFNARR